MFELHLWRRRAKFLASMHYLWGSVGLLAVTLAVLLMAHGKQEACLRWWSMVLQSFGIVMVVVDLRGAQHQFRQPGPAARIREKLAGWPKRQRAINLTAEAGTLELSDSSTATLTVGVVPGTGLEGRIDSLERGLEHLQRDLESANAEAAQERRDRKQADRAEAVARMQADQAIETKLAEVSTGSYTFSLFGVFWLAVGLVLGSTSPEMAKWAGMLAKWTGWTW